MAIWEPMMPSIGETHTKECNDSTMAGCICHVGAKAYGAGESDPTGRDQHEPGAKTDNGKPDTSLLGYFGNALLAVSEVGTYGAKKYTRGGWQSVPDGINRYTAAMLRHYLAENYEEFDRDLPVMHAAQVAWNALARLELMLREKKNGGETHS